jgi:hypothetical protein
MSWPAARVLAAFLVAGLTVWFSPMLIGAVGLGEFAFVGQLCATVLVLSMLESVFGRLP